MTEREYFQKLKNYLDGAKEAARDILQQENDEEADVICTTIDNTIEWLQTIRTSISMHVERAKKEGFK